MVLPGPSFFANFIAPEILIPEENMGLNRLLESLDRSEKSGKSSSIVVIAEGGKTGKNVFEIAEYVEKNMPHYEVRVSVLGHIQRGGSPSCFDRVLASRMGVHAIESLQKGAWVLSPRPRPGSWARPGITTTSCLVLAIQ